MNHKISKRIPMLAMILFIQSFGLLLHAQDVKVSIHMTKVKMEAVMNEIEHQTKYLFGNRDDVDLNHIVTVNVTNAPLKKALDAMVAGSNVTYSINGYNIVLSNTASQQQSASGTLKMSGKVVDSNGEPVIGAAVYIPGTMVGVSTDRDGNYSLSFKSGHKTVTVSCIGYVTKEVLARNGTVNIVLDTDVNMLEDAVVIGYGTLEKKLVTSSITSISSEDIISGQGGSTIATALKGKISGMSIDETSSPNSSATFQLRGVASINAAASPLVVIDGVPGADIRAVNFEDVLSIDVLKDASAGAIYGTRAAAGVILITTKKPEEGPIKMTYNGEFSTEQVSNRPLMLEAKDFVRFGIGTDYGYDTDWYDALLNEWALSQKHTVTIQGGGKVARLYTTFIASNQKGISIGDNRKDYSGRINGTFNLFDEKLQINIHSEYREAHRDQRASSSYFGAAMNMNPTMSIYDETSDSGYNILIGGGNYLLNPVAEIELKQADKIDKWILADVAAKLILPYGFSINTTAGWQDRQAQWTNYTSALHRAAIEGGYNGSGYHAFSKTIDLTLEPTINFDRHFGDHTINAVAGYSFFEQNGENFSMTNSDFAVDGLGPWDMGAGKYLQKGDASMSSHKYPRTRLIAFFGRVNYNYMSKYILSASLRHEGSSKFGRDHRWGNFWAVSGGWRISSESWMKDFSWLDDLKLRAGYGVTGNNGFDAGLTSFQYSSGTYWPMNGTWIMSYGPANNVNYDLHWEEKSELNIGVDYAFLQNRLFGKFDWYHRWVNGMIYNITVNVPPALNTSTVMNYGDLENWGWEFEVGGSPVRKQDFEWTTTMRFSHNKSKITSLWGNHTYQDRMSFPAPGTPGSAGRIEDGTTIGSYYLWKYAGLNEEGKWLIYNKDNDIILADNKTYDDKRYIGNAIPKLMISWDNNFRYKNLTLGVTMRSWLKYDVFNMTNMYYGINTGSGRNVLREALIDNRFIKQEKLLCDYWLEDGSFLKIDVVSLAYTLHMKKWQKYIDTIDIYATVRNAYCFTNYSGLNPEVDVTGLDPGYEPFNQYPETRRYALGLRINF